MEIPSQIVSRTCSFLFSARFDPVYTNVFITLPNKVPARAFKVAGRPRAGDKSSKSLSLNTPCFFSWIYNMYSYVIECVQTWIHIHVCVRANIYACI